MQEQAAKIGVRINIAPLDWSIFVDKQKQQDFDMYYGGWAFSPAPLDLKQLWHTQYWLEKGDNSVGFGDAQTDLLLENLRHERDEGKRNDLYRRFQVEVYRAQPYIFLVNQVAVVAVHRRFRGSKTSALRPNFQANAFWTPAEFVKYH